MDRGAARQPHAAAIRAIPAPANGGGLTLLAPRAYITPATNSDGGRMAEWLCRGLQILVQRFDSASGLHETRPRPVGNSPGRALIPGSSVVEQAAVNRWVDGSNPSRGANQVRGSGECSRSPATLLRSNNRPMEQMTQ